MSTTGSRVVTRAAALLRIIASGGADGLSTTEVARSARIPRPTAHRLLVALNDEGMVDRDRQTGRWSLSPELYLVGTTASSRYDITGEARGIIDVLARETGESVFLSVRRGDETVCV